MKILLSAYACEPSKGSEPGVGWNWALALIRRGHEVWVLTRKNNQDIIEQELMRLGEPYASYLHFLYYDLPHWAAWWKKGGRGVYLYYALWQRGILRIARESHLINQFNVVHHLTFGVWRQPTQLYKLGIPCIFGPVGGGEAAPWPLVHGMPRMRSGFSEYLRFSVNNLSLLSPSLRSCLMQTKWVISKTHETAAWVARVGANSSVFLEIGINPERVTSSWLESEIGKLRCLYAGRLIGWKGIHLALAAVAEAHAKGVDITFTIVGYGPLASDLQKKADVLGIGQQVTFTGQLNQADLFAKYREHDLLLFPSLHDSSGNVVLESFANGLPVLCLNLGGPGVMVDETCGRAIDADNVDQDTVIARLASSLVEFANSPELMRRFRDGARVKAIASSWDATVGRVYAPVEQYFLKEGS